MADGDPAAYEAVGPPAVLGEDDTVHRDCWTTSVTTRTTRRRRRRRRQAPRLRKVDSKPALGCLPPQHGAPPVPRALPGMEHTGSSLDGQLQPRSRLRCYPLAIVRHDTQGVSSLMDNCNQGAGFDAIGHPDVKKNCFTATTSVPVHMDTGLVPQCPKPRGTGCC